MWPGTLTVMPHICGGLFFDTLWACVVGSSLTQPAVPTHLILVYRMSLYRLRPACSGHFSAVCPNFTRAPCLVDSSGIVKHPDGQAWPLCIVQRQWLALCAGCAL